MNKNKFLATSDNLTIVFKNTTYTYQLPSNIGQVIKLLKEGKFEKAIKIIHKKFLIEEISNGKIKETEKGMAINGQELPDSVKAIVERLIKDKKPVDGILNLWKRISNYSEKVSKEAQEISRESLFDYLVNSCVRILDNGCFVAYKGVRSDYKDCHSGKFDNTPGKVVSMPRNQVTLDRSDECAPGLHVGSFNYMKSYYNNGNRWLECLVDPRDVVSVPHDYNRQKMRVCKYKVIRDVTDLLSDEVLKGASTLYEGYVEPINEAKIVKKVEPKKKPVPIKPLKNSEKKKVEDKPKIKVLDAFEVKRISEGRLAITKTILSKIGMTPGRLVGIYMAEDCIELYTATSHADFELRVVSDGSIRLSKTTVDRLGEKSKKFTVSLVKDSKKTWLEIRK